MSTEHNFFVWVSWEPKQMGECLPKKKSVSFGNLFASYNDLDKFDI